MGKPQGKDRKKLSWTYRNKKRQGKISKPEKTDKVQIQNNKARIIVRNLSFKVTEDDIKKLFSPYGTVEELEILKRPDGKPVGCGFVQFKRIEDASKAIFNTNKKEFLGRTISSAWAIPKAKFIQQLEKNRAESRGNNEVEVSVEDGGEDEVRADTTQDNSIEKIAGSKRPRAEKKKLTSDERKAIKLQKRLKRARIIVRNLSFKATEKILQEHFEQYGPIEMIEILKRENGKRVGCAFVQFENVQSAAKAIHYSNMKPICERPVIVDWAVPKKKFVSSNNDAEIKQEDSEDLKPEINDDCIQISHNLSEHEKENNESTGGSEDEHNEEDDESESMADEDDKNDEDVKNESIIEEKLEVKRPRVISHDVSEGKTVFLKNVPFSATNQDLKSCMEQFGPVYYALICMDSLTEHSKGTAFVKFRNVEDAEKCLSAGTELRLHDQVLDPHKALDKKDVPDGDNIKTKRIKDSRNLYLVKEGVILAGTPSAEGVSASDMAKRLQLEQWKSQMLRNLNMFVSRIRLVVHNLPPKLDDATFRTILKNHAGPKAIIQEARIMRDLKNPDANNIGKSKEFGFAAFTSHEDALRALRSLNNNPNVFSESKRPIVAFSIENRIMVNAKQRRIERSREQNPLWKGKRKENSAVNKSNESVVKRTMKNFKNSETNHSEDVKNFAGITSKPGASTKLRSKFKLKVQAQLHSKTLKSEKKQKKIEQTLRAKKISQKLAQNNVKTKQGSKKLSKEDSNFNKLVDNYRSKLSSALPNNSKWYET